MIECCRGIGGYTSNIAKNKMDVMCIEGYTSNIARNKMDVEIEDTGNRRYWKSKIREIEDTGNRRYGKLKILVNMGVHIIVKIYYEQLQTFLLIQLLANKRK